mmetsp:Transcript_25224/g.31804  ORF Transcript_25224/g.31804 Transcript_25224/m.31804 type:complete len:149 (-) Transcript_25224:161-607(-)
MVLSIDVPDNYGYVLLCCGVLPAFTNFYLSTKVMGARKAFNVKYPNLYATPGYHDKADDFNRVQRGHQHVLESISDFRICSIIGGLAYPNVVACCGIIYSLGNILYMEGYKDTKLDVSTARLKKGGPIQFLAVLVVMVCSALSAYSLL